MHRERIDRNILAVLDFDIKLRNQIKILQVSCTDISIYFRLIGSIFLKKYIIVPHYMFFALHISG